MRLMQNIVPGKLSPDLMGHILRVRRLSAEGNYKKATWKTIWFVMSRLFILIFGIDAFLFKFRACAKHAIHTSSFSDFVVCFLFLNQMLGVVHLTARHFRLRRRGRHRRQSGGPPPSCMVGETYAADLA
eukprot:CAMPEP_0115545706 /NCGR_PEP_ID=MMETSP0271-20121206/92742_1 /TAXON_ID=71861 /ORGANISM="Scrippsiella trochoidea, Strain CCMP3099" /LENGTH=128 /DNA_ID=CAMNT_0002979061 /DNA_START=263 /DNA_END=645 /DNA_ORIENTATION=+